MRSFFLLLFFTFPLLNFSQAEKGYDQISKVDFKSINAEVTINPINREVLGSIEFIFEVLEETDSVFIDAKNMEFENAILNNRPVEIHTDKDRLWIINNFSPSEENILNFKYIARPIQTMYFINWNISPEIKANRQVWTQGQGRYTSHWLPSFDDTREKVVFNISYAFNKEYEVVANGELTEKTTLNDSLLLWKYEMENPMSSYLVAMAAGNYSKEEIVSASGIPVFLYFSPEEKNKVEPTYRYTKDIFDFLEAETGVPYPWQNYKQIPVQDFLYSGMENTGATIFSSTFVVDSIGYNDRNYVNVNAHELAHQWFGNYVTAESDEHHWLQEGFSTFYALLAEREIFGEEHYYWKLYESAEELKTLSDSGKGEALLKAGGSSLTYYQKGAWALHILKEKVGEDAFNKAVKGYLEKNAYSSVTTGDFISEVEEVSGQNLDDYERDWLRQSAFQGTEALNSLKNSEFITRYMEVAALREISFQNKIENLERALEFPVNDYIGQEAVFQLAGENHPDAIKLYKKAFESGNLYVRQAIALSMEEIPAELKKDFESLLQDESYLTIENALLQLWLEYPEETGKWLELTEGIEGFSNKNVEMLWLVINMVSPDVNKTPIQNYYTRLSSYTREHYPFEVRQNAFGYLYQINAFSEENLINIVKAAQHHNTRFRDYSRQLLAELLKTAEYREKFSNLLPELSGKDQEFLKLRLNP